MKKRLVSFTLTLIFCLSLTVSMVPDSGAADLTSEEKAQALYNLGLFKGTGNNPDGTPNFALESSATRNQAATMLIRLLGKESKAAAQMTAGSLVCPFTDLSGAMAANVTWLYENNYVNGTSATTYSGTSTVSAQQFAAMILRSLGYSESNGDYTYAGALDFAVSKGLLTSEQRTQYSSSFLRSGIVEMCYNALYTTMRDSKLQLFDKLTNDGVFSHADTTVANTAAVTLTQKYSGGGAFKSEYYAQEADACTPVVTDIDGDGKQEILYNARSIFCLDAATGTTKWHINSGKDRSSGYTSNADFGRSTLDLQVVDLDGDGKREIVAVNTYYGGGGGYSCIAVYDSSGYFKSGWPVKTSYAVYALHIADLDRDGKKEICIGLGVGASMSPAIYVYEMDGSVRSGWPQKCGYGLFSDSLASADLDGDSKLELVVLFDETFLNAFHADGTSVSITSGTYAGLTWSGVPVCENYDHEMVCMDWAKTHGGSAYANGPGILGSVREDRNAIMGTHGGVVAEDLDGNGTTELAFTCLMVDGAKLMQGDTSTFAYSGQYFTTFILNTDRTRYTNTSKGFDWTQMPTFESGSYVTIDSSLLPMVNNVPVAADVDGDGNQEILYSANDGMVHCWSLDGTEHGAWPYNLDPRSSNVISYATKPVCADINGDGKLEVIFASYTQSNQTAVRGKVYILDCTGKVLGTAVLPVRYESPADLESLGANGAYATPAAADIDGDGKYEIVVSSLYCGIVTYEIG